MPHVLPTAGADHRLRPLVVLVVIALAALGFRALAESSLAATVLSLTAETRSVSGSAGGDLPDGATAFDAHFPGVANLAPALARALRAATTDAARDGVELHLNSGWRSAARQEELLREAVATYGSKEAALRWVATATTSSHVSGDAVDVGPSAASTWLAAHGAAYGLCRTYGNEPWHFELRRGAVERGCPVPYADPTQDPRMQP